MNAKRFLKSPYLWAFLIGIISLHLVKQAAMARRSAPEPLMTVPEWSLTSEQGRPFGKKELQGKMVFANYFFTSCPSICPKLTQAMKDVYERFKDKQDLVEFISITVDPETDTPEVLKAFMQKNGIDHENWHALTGTKKEIYDVVVEKMHVHVGEKEPLPQGADGYDIPHLGQLALFDQNGDLRGLFNTDSVELSALVRAANFLIEKGP